MAKSLSETENPEFFAGNGELAALMRVTDWSKTPLGLPGTWPQSLRTTVRIMLTSRYAMWMGWGSDLTFFYNDAYRPTLGIKHPWALGRPARQVWAEIWPDIGPRIEKVLQSGEATWDEALLLFLERSGFPEETYHTFSYSPVSDDQGTIAGMLCVVTEETERIIGERRLSLLREVAADLAAANSESEVLAAIDRQLRRRQDIPFAFTYLFDPSGRTARLATASELPTKNVVPKEIDLSSEAALWPAREILEGGEIVLIEDLAACLSEPPLGPWDRPARQALVVPIGQQGQERPAGFLVAGINPYRPLDSDYRGFLDLLVGQIASALANAHAYEAERRRAEELAKLDQAKTVFFSNVSHELRTPLTLMLGPIEDSLAADAELAPDVRSNLKLAHRNSLRLLKLVNTLLDFSRIEAGRVQARFQPLDLSALTTELASNFHSAAQRAGLVLTVDCPPLTEPVYVDRDMWEKVVLNLLSNAFKYTFQGGIEVRLRSEAGRAVLTVRDTGAGIPEDAIPRLFERFYRVDSIQGRTHEGTGIGLALVQELVRLHGGAISVDSEVGEGSVFTVSIPTGKDHLPPERISDRSEPAPDRLGANPYVEEALRWLPEAADPSLGEIDAPPAPRQDAPKAKVLLADDNADMREYLRRLLADRFEVHPVEDGLEALEAARQARPDLILTDVMMPRLDGFGLLTEVRNDPALQDIPVIVLSARAGEEAKVEGLAYGANDYLVKPFSARELLARVQSNLMISQLRREATQREIDLRVEAEEARTRLELVLRGMRDQFFVLDRNLCYTFASDSTCEVTGLSREELLGNPVLDLFPDLRGSEFEAALHRVLSTGRPTQIELEYTAWGRWFENRLFPTSEGGIADLVVDVTERRQAQALLQQSEFRLRRFAESLPQIAWECQADGSTAWFNQTFYEYTGLRPGEGLGWAWTALLHPADLPRVTEQWKRCIETGTVLIAEARLRRADGEMRWWLIQVVPMRDGAGFVELWYGSATDIHDQKEAEQQLERRVEERTAELTEANREMEGFTYTVSHDLRAPLRSIVFNSSLLLEDLGSELSEEHKNLLLRQANSARKLATLIDDLLKLSRVSRQEMVLADVDLSALAAEVAETVAGQNAKPFRFEIRPGLHALADPQLIQFVLMNLIENACKFSPDGGTIEFGRTEIEGRPAFFVRDEGVGFEPQYADKIFQPFERLVTESEFPGTGIGLANVRRIVERHRGHVWATSQPGEGSTFYFTLGAS